MDQQQKTVFLYFLNSRRPLSSCLALFIVIILMAIAVYTGLIGIDFGNHWDEFVQYNHVMDTFDSGIILPFNCTDALCYNYPSFTYILSLISVIGNFAFKLIFDSNVHISDALLLSTLDLETFKLIVRPVFLILCSVSGLWLYLSLSKHNKIAAVFASAIQILSWEFAYHSRWIAPDAIMAQFVALWLMSLTRAENSDHRQKWLLIASMCAGLATSTKYTAGLLIFATVLFAWLIEVPSLKQVHRKQFPVRTVLRLILVFCVTFVIVTPGSLLQPFKFISDIRTEMLHYSTGHSVQYGVTPNDITSGWLYAYRLLEYLVLALPSHLPMVSVLLAGLSLVGLIHLIKNGRQAFAVTIATLLLGYFYYFSSNCVVFIVRNFLLFLPLLAFLSGNGIALIIDYSRRTRYLAIIFMATVISAHSHNLAQSAASIAGNNEEGLTRLLSGYLVQHPDEKIAASPSLMSAIGKESHSNLVSVGNAETFAYRDMDIRPLSDSLRLAEYPATRHDTFRWLGPREVNYNYYPSWSGKDRIILIPVKKAREMGILNAFTSFPLKTE